MASTVRHGSSAGDWGTKPIRFAARAAAGGAPSIVTVPSVGRSSPATIAQQRRLAAAARAEHGDDLARGDLEIDRPERFDRPEALAHALHPDAGRHGRGWYRLS